MNTRAFITQTPKLAWLIAFSVLCGGIFGNLLGSLTTEISGELHLSTRQIGWLIFWGNAGSAVGAFIGGDIAHRFRPHTLIVLYLSIMGIAVGLLASSHSFLTLNLSFILYEVVVVGLFTLSHTLIGHMDMASSIRARVLAVLDVGWSIGASIAPLWVIAFLHFYPSWRLPYAAFILLLVGLIAAYTRPRFRQAVDQLSHFSHASSESETEEKTAAARHSYRQLLTAPWAVWAWIAAVLIGYVEWGHSYWFVNYAHTGHHIPLDQARVGLVGFTLGMVLVRGWQAFIHSTLSIEQRMLCLGLIGCAAYILLAWMPSDNLLVFFPANLLAGIGIGVTFPILLNHLIDFSPKNTAKFSALLMFSIILGAQLAGIVIGYTSEHWGIQTAYGSIALAMLGFFAAAIRLFHIHKQHTPIS